MGYDPNQPRDEEGEWTTSGGGSHTKVKNEGTHSSKHAAENRSQASMDAHKAVQASVKKHNPVLRTAGGGIIGNIVGGTIGGIAGRVIGGIVGGATLGPGGAVVGYLTGATAGAALGAGIGTYKGAKAGYKSSKY